MADKITAQLGGAEETLFIPLAARARETGKRHPLLSDPRAVELVQSIDLPVGKYDRGRGSVVMVLRTALFDAWVRSFLDTHPHGTVVEIGTGLNTRFDRVDNGTVHWFDLDLPDTIALRRRFFADTDRRHSLAASVLDDDWMDRVATSPGPYLFVAEAVLVYLPEDDVRRTLTRIAHRFPDAGIALDTYSRRMMRMQHNRVEAAGLDARWGWACDDPRALESLGLRLVESTTIARPPQPLRRRLPLGYRITLPLLHQFLLRIGAFRVALLHTRPHPDGPGA
ncbi:class I SAM-dependent methyltransferase [Tsukamurella soli]|uniref:Class I SAM-dependent methyltransferase n=1 Tax=Tsukamurella soli TaxID=644556 RepID=A0ABP8JAX8_9ACTN